MLHVNSASVEQLVNQWDKAPSLCQESSGRQEGGAPLSCFGSVGKVPLRFLAVALLWLRAQHVQRVRGTFQLANIL